LQASGSASFSDFFSGNNTNCGKYDHIRAFTVETPRRGVSTEFMIFSNTIGIITKKSEKLALPDASNLPRFFP